MQHHPRQRVWHKQQKQTCLIVCHAKAKGQGKLFERYKANRAKHEGILLPLDEAPSDGLAPISIEPLQQMLHQAIWSYTFGQERQQVSNASWKETQPAASQLGQASPPADQTSGSSQASHQQSQGAIIPPPSPASLDMPDDLVPSLPPPHNPAKAKVYVYWDVASKHPGGADPRVVAARISSLAARFGAVQGLYAYAVRKDWNWVPQHFLQYRTGTEQASSGFRCSVCGVSRRSQAELDAHVRSVHAGKNTLPGSAQQASQLLSTRNTSRRTLGRVATYHTASGQVRVPPAGHQLSLKYCLSQEGWQARIVQNAAEAESVAMASGMGRLLDQLRRGTLALLPGERPVIICVSDDLARLQQPLMRLRGIGGAATISVHSGLGVTRGADLTLSWEQIIYGL